MSRPELWHKSVPKRINVPTHDKSVITRLQLIGGRIFAASDDHTITLHSAATGELLKTFTGHTGGVWDFVVCSSPVGSDYEVLVSGSTDKTLRIWDVQSGRNTHTFHGHTGPIRCIAQTTLGTSAIVVTGSRDNTLIAWRLPLAGDEEFEEDDIDMNPYLVSNLNGHTQGVRSVAAHERIVVSGSYDNDVRVWDVGTGLCTFVLKGHTDLVNNVVIDAPRNQVFSASKDGSIRIWSLEDGSERGVLKGHTAPISTLSLSSDTLVSGSSDSTILVWDLQTHGLIKTLAGEQAYPVNDLKHDEDRIIAGSGGSLRIWSTKGDSVVPQDLLKGLEGVWTVDFDGRFCVAGTSQNDATILEILDFEGAEVAGPAA